MVKIRKRGKVREERAVETKMRPKERSLVLPTISPSLAEGLGKLPSRKPSYIKSNPDTRSRNSIPIDQLAIKVS